MSVRAAALSAGPSVARTFIALTIRDFRYLWVGGFASQIGMWLQIVAQAWLAYDLTNSAVFLGILGLTRSVPAVALTLPAGVLADRWDRRRMMVSSQLIGMLNALALAWLVATDTIEPWHLVASGVVGAVTMSFNMPARQALAPQLAGYQHTANAVALNSISFNLSRVLGPALAGALIGLWGIAACFLVQAAGFVWSMAWTIAIDRERAAPTSARRGSMWANLGDGVRYVRTSPLLSGLWWIAAVPIVLGMAYMQLMPVFARDILDVGPSGMGMLMMVVGFGALGGSFIAAWLSAYPRKGLLLMGSGLIVGPGLVAFALSQWLPLSLAALVLLGVSQALCMVVNQIMLNLVCANEYRGRVLSLYMMTWHLSPLFFVPLGWLADVAGARLALALVGLVVGISMAAIGAWRREVRHFRDDDPSVEGNQYRSQEAARAAPR